MSREDAFSRIQVEAEIFDHYVVITYRGEPTDLIEVGAMTQPMTSFEKGRKRLDSFGDRFTCHRIRSGNAVEVVRYVTDLNRARALPGVPSNLSLDWLDFLTSHPDQVYERDTGSLHESYFYGTKEALVREGLVSSSDSCDEHLNGFVGVFSPKRTVRSLNSKFWRGFLLGVARVAVLDHPMSRIKELNAEEDAQLSGVDLDRIKQILERSYADIRRVIEGARLIRRDQPVLRLVINNDGGCHV